MTKLENCMRMCASIGALPSSYVDSMSYEEQILWLCKFLDEKILPAVEQDIQDVKDLKEWFNNLDVQDEVNNKIEDMLESGELEEIIGQYITKYVPKVYPNLNNIKSRSFVEGEIVTTTGYYEPNDGGGSKYIIRTTQPSNVYYETLNNGKYAELIADVEVNVKQLGAKGDGTTDDTNAFKKFASSNFKRLLIPEGTYNLHDILVLDNKELIGIGKPTITYVEQTTADEHYIKFTTSIVAENITFKQLVNNTDIVGLYNCSNSRLSNCSFIGDGVICKSELDLYTNNNNILIENCYFKLRSVNNEGTNSVGGIWVREYTANKESYNITFENCVVDHQSKDEAIACWDWVGKVHHVNINNCKIVANENATCAWFITFDVDNSSINNCLLETKQSGTTLQGMLKGYNINENIELNNCDIKLYVTVQNTFNSQLKAKYKNCNIGTPDATLEMNNIPKYYNCIFNVKNIYFGAVKLYDCVINTSSNPHNKVFIRLNAETEMINCTFNGVIFGSGLFIQSLANFNKFVLRNTKFNATFSNLSVWMNTGAFSGTVDIENCDIGGTLYGTGTYTGNIINNTTKGNISSFGNCKLNNNFNIN